jgi:hypothetical protein
MEFVIVSFRDPRGVNIDGAPRGQTGQRLRLQAGTHNFDLGLPVNYTPPSVLTPVRGTTAANPMIIAFRPLALQLARGAAPTRKKGKKKAPRRSSARKSATKKATARKTRARTRGKQKVR